MILAIASTGAHCSGTTRDVRRAETRNDIAKNLLTSNPPNLTGAEVEVKKALGYDPQNEEAYLIWGSIEAMRARQNLALVERSDCLSGVDAEALRGQADASMRQAEAHWKKATSLASDYGEAWQNLGAVAIYFQDWDKAAEYEEKALANLARLPSETTARANLGWARFKQRNYVEAAANLLQAAQGSQYACLASYRLAEVYFAREEFEDALDRLRPVLENPKLCPPVQEAQHLGGQVFLKLHDRDSATTAFEQCIAMAPKSCQARACDTALQSMAP
jgi:type IV pilus assembly protein PilF